MHLSLACLAGCDSDVITLEVHNDGFSYVSYPGERLPRHHSVMGEQPGKAFTLELVSIRRQLSGLALHLSQT